MIKVDLVCDIDSPSGYSAHARELAKAIDPYVDLRIVAHKHDRETVAVSKEDKKRIDDWLAKDRPADVRIQFETPEFFDPVDGVLNIGFTQWETSRIPATDSIPGSEKTSPKYNWVTQMNNMHSMWTSCTFAAAAFQVSGVTVPVHVVQGPVDTELYKAREEELMLEDLVVSNDKPIPRSERPVALGMVAQWTPRKGIDDFLVTAFSRFKRDEVVIVLKTYGSNMSQKEQTVCVEEVKRYRKLVRNPDSPRCIVLTQKLTDQDMARLYNSFDIYVNASRGEGLCLPLAQSMATGVVPVSCGFSAPSDYVNQTNGFMVNYSLEPAVYQYWSPWYRFDQDWGRIDLGDLEKKLRAAIDEKRSYPHIWKARQTAARDSIVRRMSPQAIGLRVKMLLEKALGSVRMPVESA